VGFLVLYIGICTCAPCYRLLVLDQNLQNPSLRSLILVFAGAFSCRGMTKVDSRAKSRRAERLSETEMPTFGKGKKTGIWTKK